MLIACQAAVVFTLALGMLWSGTRDRRLLRATVAWGVYAVYEYLMHARVLCSGDCGIRVDLLVIVPVLIGLALWAVGTVVGAWWWRRRQG